MPPANAHRLFVTRDSPGSASPCYNGNLSGIVSIVDSSSFALSTGNYSTLTHLVQSSLFSLISRVSPTSTRHACSGTVVHRLLHPRGRLPAAGRVQGGVIRVCWERIPLLGKAPVIPSRVWIRSSGRRGWRRRNNFSHIIYI
jgi:hypothetical protein